MKTSAEAGNEAGITRLVPTGIKEGRIAIPVGLGVLSFVLGFFAVTMIGLSRVPVEAGTLEQQPQETGDSVLFLAMGIVLAGLSVLSVAMIPRLLGRTETLRTRVLATVVTAFIVVLLLAGAFYLLSQLANVVPPSPPPMD